MSHTTRRPIIAIAGATGNLGEHLTRAILIPEFRVRFGEVFILSRSESSKTADLISLGAKLRLYTEDRVEESLLDVDVLVNAIGPSGHKFNESLLQFLPRSSVKLYFPSEFGVDHYTHDFGQYLWDAKKGHYAIARQLVPGIQICRVFSGLFLEDSIGPWFGFFTGSNKYEAVGSPDQPASYTSMHDVGKAVAILASSPLDCVPPEVHLSGDSKSMSAIAQIMERHGSGSIQVTSVPIDTFKHSVLETPNHTPERYLRFLIGEGLIDHTTHAMGNQNDLIERDSHFSTWKSLEDLATETKGRPWTDYDWAI